MIVLIAVAILTGCTGKRENAENITEVTTSSGAIDNDKQMAEYVRDIAQIDCKLLIIYTEGINDENKAAYKKEVDSLRREKFRLVELALKDDTDSALRNSYTKQLEDLVESDEYCPGLKKLRRNKDIVNMKGVSDKQLKIREDAVKLASLKCKIMQIRKSIQEGSVRDIAAAEQQLEILKNQKWLISNNLVEIYGQNILRDKYFRGLVVEEQNKICDFSKEIRTLHRPDPDDL